MDQALWKVAEAYGPWVALTIGTLGGAVWLIRYVLITSTHREERLVGVIDRQSTAFEAMTVTQNKMSDRLDGFCTSLDRIERKLP